MVYIITSSYIDVDSGDCDTRVDGVYAKLEEAKEKFDQLVEETRKDFEPYDYEEDCYGTSFDLSYSIYEKGEYMSHHCDIIITECEIK